MDERNLHPDPIEQFATWFRRALLTHVDEKVVRLAVQNPFTLEWIKSYYVVVIEESIVEVLENRLQAVVDRLANRGTRVAKLTSGPGVAHHCERCPLLRHCPQSSADRHNAEDVEEVWCHELNGRKDRRAVRHHPDFSACMKGHVLEHLIPLAPIAKVGRRRDGVRLKRVRPERLHRDDSIR